MFDWIQSFSKKFGAAVCTDSATLNAQSIQGVAPACLCAPESALEAAAVIRFAAAHGIPVVPCGGGNSQGRCAAPLAGFLALSTKRLNTLIHHEPGDMVATVQGGMETGAFQRALSERGQWLPIDAAAASTIGGIVAANTHGPRALGYGTLRDMVLGMTVVNGDGVIRKCGGKVVKNVTGYALDKLYIGSFGTLGLITEVTFKLHPNSGVKYAGSAVLDSLAGALTAMELIAAKNLPLELLEIVVRAPAERPVLFVRATGTDAELRRIDLEISAAAKLDFNATFGATDEPSPAAEEDRPAIAKSVQDGRMEFQLRFGCVPSKLRAAMEILRPHANARQFLGINGGVVLLSGADENEAARIAAGFEKLGVNFAFENIAGVNIRQRWGSPRPEWAIMRQIKAALDPSGIMNPGRFVV